MEVTLFNNLVRETLSKMKRNHDIDFSRSIKMHNLLTIDNKSSEDAAAAA